MSFDSFLRRTGDHPAILWGRIIALIIVILHASIMPVQYDEAYTIMNILKNGTLASFTQYEVPNNHPLLSFLMGLLLQGGAASTFLFRLPALLSTLAIFVAADRLARHLPTIWRILLPFCMLSMPLFFDYFAQDRGYVLGLAFLLWGMVLFDRSWIWSAILFAGAVMTVPTFALDVALIGIFFCLSRQTWQRAIKTVVTAAVISIVAYAFIIQKVIATIVESSSAHSAGENLTDFFSVMSIGGVWAGIPIIVVGVACAWYVHQRGLPHYVTLLLLSLLVLPIGFARNHILAAFLIVFLILAALPPRSWIVLLLSAYSAFSIFSFHYDVLTSYPDTWLVTGYSKARVLVPCMLLQAKGAFSVPDDYYRNVEKTTPAPDPNCAYVLVATDPPLNAPHERRLFPEKLDQYHVELFNREDVM